MLKLVKQDHLVFIVLNWNDWKSTLLLLSQLLKIDCPAYICKIIIVDNGSTDDSLKFIRKWLLMNKINFIILTENELFDCSKLYSSVSVILIANFQNKGYTGGMNTGIKYALNCLNPSFLLLLNNDLAVDVNFVNELYTAPGDIRGPQVLNYYTGEFIPQPQVYLNLPLMSLFSKISSNLVITEKHCAKQKPLMVTRLEGSCIMVSAEVFRRVGLFDEAFFSYWEDVDLFLRARKNGYKITFVPSSIVRHKVGSINLQIKKSNPRAAYYLSRNGILFIKKHYKGIKKFGLLIFYLLYSVYMFSVYLLYLRDLHSALLYLAGVVKALFGEVGISTFPERYLARNR